MPEFAHLRGHVARLITGATAEEQPVAGVTELREVAS
jgi:hypothetical protein